MDATVSRTTAIPFFGDGSAHAGFYSSLFPMSTGDADGYGQVLRSLKHIAREMGGSAEKPIPLWVTVSAEEQLFLPRCSQALYRVTRSVRLSPL